MGSCSNKQFCKFIPAQNKTGDIVKLLNKAKSFPRDLQGTKNRKNTEFRERVNTRLTSVKWTLMWLSSLLKSWLFVCWVCWILWLWLADFVHFLRPNHWQETARKPQIFLCDTFSLYLWVSCVKIIIVLLVLMTFWAFYTSLWAAARFWHFLFILVTAFIKFDFGLIWYFSACLISLW